jgi:ribosomal protein S15P/S13E
MKDQSIHPRVSAGTEKVNTCANSSLMKRMTRQLAGIEKHLEKHPRDALSQQRVSTIKTILSGQPVAKAKAA